MIAANPLIQFSLPKGQQQQNYVEKKTQMNETMMEKSEERDRHEGRLDTV